MPGFVKQRNPTACGRACIPERQGRCGGQETAAATFWPRSIWIKALAGYKGAIGSVLYAAEAN